MELLLILLFIGLAVIYFAPTIILMLRNATGGNGGSFVIVVNVFMGWSVIGWFIALVMAFAVKGKNNVG